MGIIVEDFPGCCSASVLTDFGQSSTSEYGYRHKAEYNKMYRQVVGAIKVNRNQGIIVAITTDEQKIGMKVLADLGFTATEPLKKLRHAERTIQLWHLPVNGWKEPKVVPKLLPKRDANGRFAKKAVNVFAQPKQEYIKVDVPRTKFNLLAMEGRGMGNPVKLRTDSHHVAYSYEVFFHKDYPLTTFDSEEDFKNKMGMTLDNFLFKRAQRNYIHLIKNYI